MRTDLNLSSCKLLRETLVTSDLIDSLVQGGAVHLQFLCSTTSTPAALFQDWDLVWSLSWFSSESVASEATAMRRSASTPGVQHRVVRWANFVKVCRNRTGCRLSVSPEQSRPFFLLKCRSLVLLFSLFQAILCKSLREKSPVDQWCLKYLDRPICFGPSGR